jgi:ribosomal protein S18 acetylase RimI-like enzyme
MAALSFARADEVPAAALIDAFNAAFADYLLRFPPLDDEGWRQFVTRQGADLALGRVALRAGEVVAFLLVTPRAPRRSRIAVMGARPAERGSGVAARLLDDAIGAARQRGERSVELEVFAQNPRALALYRSRGFEAVCALHGFVSEPAPGAAAEPKDLDAVTRDDAVRWLAEAEAADAGRWPWQVGSAAVASAPGEVNCWRLGQAQLLAALRAGYPTRTLQAPQLQRNDGPALAFDAAGWARLPLHQLLLRLPLDERDLGQSQP